MVGEWWVRCCANAMSTSAEVCPIGCGRWTSNWPITVTFREVRDGGQF